MTRKLDTDISDIPARLDGVRVAITGGTSGLGLALVAELTRRGARVAFVARTPGPVQDVARTHPGTYGIVHPCVVALSARLNMSSRCVRSSNR